MDICIRGINSNVVKALETSAKKHDLSREEYLRQCLERIAYDDRRWEANMSSSCKSCFSVWKASKNSLVF